jgi:hypothetical protein
MSSAFTGTRQLQVFQTFTYEDSLVQLLQELPSEESRLGTQITCRVSLLEKVRQNGRLLTETC